MQKEGVFIRHSRYVETSLKPYQGVLKRIRELDAQGLPEQRDPSLLPTWKDRIRQAQSDTDRESALKNALVRLLPEVYAQVCAAVRQTFGWTVFDSQLLGAVAMQQGRVIELDTGEGKTLAAVFVACLHALAGRGVHVLTFNDYLARRDANWMRPIYEWMGLTVAAVQSGMAIEQRKAAYACDVTYLTAKEAGFDYLRGFLALSEQELAQRPFYMAIVDEADSILIDEARIPLIIASDSAGPGSIDPALYRLVSGMRQGRHYGRDTFGEHVLITEEGAIWLEHHLGIANLYASEQVGLLTQVRLILQAKTLFRRDVDYIVRDGRIELVDEFTGRIVENRQLPEGLHEAVEIKEGLSGKMQGHILNRITLRDFMSLYEHICGMTGTAWSAAPELDAFYRLGVTRIPPHVPCRRMDQPDLIFRTKAEKEQAILREISQRHASGQPVLVGTASVEESERLVDRVRERGFACEVLNARHDETEAEIIAQAGQAGAITISTNMAGRGVDIRLGKGVAAGLYIIGTNRHRSIRIDRQLRGRAGRQGDPGESRFFVSLQDDLIERYQVRKVLPPIWQSIQPDAQEDRGAGGPVPIADPVVAEAIEHTQRVIEGQLFQQRLSLTKYVVLVEEQRQQIHQLHMDLITHREVLKIWQDRRPERSTELMAACTPAHFQATQQKAGALLLNQGWSDHLEMVELLLDHVALMRTGSGDPWITFHQQIIAAYAQLLDTFESDMLALLDRLAVVDGSLDLGAAGLTLPPMTRTYLIEDGSDALDQNSELSNMIAAAMNPSLYGLLILAKWWRRHQEKRKKDPPSYREDDATD